MATEIRVPTLGESVTEATVGKWFKKAGDAIAADEPLVELETDKVTIEVPAPAAGVLAEIAVQEGETVGVAALLGTIAEGAGAAAPAAKKEEPKAPAKVAEPKAEPAKPAAAAAAAPAAGKTDMPPSPSAARVLAEAGVSADQVAGSGKRGVGFVQGLGMRRGAVGFTYHPGPCELAIIGASEADMALVGNRIAELGGGLVVAVDGKVLAEVPMPLHGIVSDASAEEVEAGMRHAKRVIAEELGIDFISNYYRLTGFFIPGVSPELRMSVRGLLRVAYAGDQLKVEPIPVLLDAAVAGS